MNLFGSAVPEGAKGKRHRHDLLKDVNVRMRLHFDEALYSNPEAMKCI
jgi:hypothetical protein